jgi:transglutaminase-like putative cysteine protease
LVGEFAHLFYAFLRVAGIEARYVWNRCVFPLELVERAG